MQTQTLENAAHTHQMYCVKCRTMVTVTGPKQVQMKSSRHALQGKCPHCSTNTYKIISGKN
jgi:Zn finger protein HypA/HybF involved in hydrogenase expression